MGKRRHREEEELPFVALMDTMTNVVGVLIIVLVMVGISLASAVNKILSDLPPVTKEEFQKMLEEFKKLPPPPADPEELKKREEIAQEIMKKSAEELKTFDTDDLAKLKTMDLAELQKQLEARRKERVVAKEATDKLQTELERLKALLDDTPVYVPPPATVVRLPNPRPYPTEPVEIKVLVTDAGVVSYQDKDFLGPIMADLEKSKSRFEFRRGTPERFARAVVEQVKDPNVARTAWPVIDAISPSFQYWQIAAAYKSLSDAGIKVDRPLLDALADVAAGMYRPLDVVGAAAAASARGDHSAWIALDPAKPPAEPIIKVSSQGGKTTYSWGKTAETVKANAEGVADYFKSLAKIPSFKNKARDKKMYDSTMLVDFVQGWLKNQVMGSKFDAKATVSVDSGLVSLSLIPKKTAMEPEAAFKVPTSVYQRALRDAKANPNSVIVFRVVKTGFGTYQEARRISDEIGVPATWEYAGSDELLLLLRGYETQLPTKNATVQKPKGDDITIKPPSRTLD